MGHDQAGWTLDGYVIPRCATGMIWLEEITNHPEQFQDKLGELHATLITWRELFDYAEKSEFFANLSDEYDMLLEEVLDILRDVISLTSAIKKDVATLIELDKDRLDEG